LQDTQIKAAQSDPDPDFTLAILLTPECPARAHHLKPTLISVPAWWFASLDPPTGPTDLGVCEDKMRNRIPAYSEARGNRADR